MVLCVGAGLPPRTKPRQILETHLAVNIIKDYSRIDEYLESNLDASISELARLVAQPSVAAQNWGLEECAALVAEMLEARGFAAQVIPTPTNVSMLSS